MNGTFKCDHIKRLINLTSDYIKQLSLCYKIFGLLSENGAEADFPTFDSDPRMQRGRREDALARGGRRPRHELLPLRKVQVGAMSGS